MTTAPVESITPLALHPALLKMAPELAALTRQLYGRDWTALVVASEKFSLSFGEVHAKRADMQLRVRCGGQDYELQVVHAAAFADFHEALSPHVPAALQRAAVLHALAPLWQALELRFKMPVELVDLQVGVPAWPAEQALGLRMARKGLRAIQHAVLLLRTDTAQAWQQLGRTPLMPGMPSAASRAMNALVLKVYAHAEPIGLTLNELGQLAPGDVLVMDAAAAQRHNLDVHLMLHGRAVDGVLASLQGTRIVIKSVSTQPITNPMTQRSGVAASPSFAPMFAPMVKPMTKNDTTITPPVDTPPADALPVDTPAAVNRPGATAQPMLSLDSVKVNIELELACISVPLSTLRMLSVGQVFDTLQPIHGQSVVLWCGGQRLGVGQLVAVGDRLGVRVAALEPNAAASVSASGSA